MIYDISLSLLTDLYQLTMAYGYYKANMTDREAVFHLNFRKMPFKGSFAITAGLATVIDFIKNLRYSDSDLTYLSSLKDQKKQPLFDEGFLKYLSNMQFNCDIDAIEEGTVVFPYLPLIRVKGPIIQAQLLESPILNIINFQTLIATKAARVCIAAESDTVVEFGMRRAQGIDGAISASRAAYIGGCHSTSHVLAGKLFGIPVSGTHAHSWVMAFDEEIQAFETYANIMPHNCILLVDTYDSIEGVKKAIKVAKKLKNKDFNLLGVRLDSGDLSYLSIEIRKLLDREGFKDTKIMASNELDEHLIKDLKQQGSKISIWGVGTNLVTAKDQSALDGVYKLSAIQSKKKLFEYKLKISEQTAKSTNPGILQVRRYYDNQYYLADAIYDEIFKINEECTIVHPLEFNRKQKIKKIHKYKDLLVPIFRKGKCVYITKSLPEIREHGIKELKKLPIAMKRFINPKPYFAGLEQKLHDYKMNLIDQIQGL